jgi:CRP-like cAMP-binding protein
MENHDILHRLQKHIAISREEADYFFALLQPVRLKKNSFLLRRGDLDCPFILIRKGCLMTFFVDKHEFPHVIQFGMEMWWTGDLNGLINGTPSIYTIKAVVPSEVYLLNRDAFNQLCTRVPAFERYFRIIFQQSLISHQQRIIRNSTCTAEEKYRAFTESYPKLELILPQKYIASYLGITPEFLSKIRRRLAGKPVKS